MTWLASAIDAVVEPAVDRHDQRAASLTAYLPVPLLAVRRGCLTLLVASLLVGVVSAVKHHVAVDLAALDLAVVALYAVALGEPARRMHRNTRVGAGHAAVHVLTLACLIAWSYVQPLSDGAKQGRRTTTLTALAGDPHPAADTAQALQVLGWALLLAVAAGGVALGLFVRRVGRAYTRMAGPGPAA